MIVFTWATYNGATFYIDVFGRKYEKELESLRKEVQKWQSTPEGRTLADHLSPPTKAEDEKSGSDGKSHGRTKSVDNIPLLDEKEEAKTTARVEEEQTQPFKRS